MAHPAALEAASSSYGRIGIMAPYRAPNGAEAEESRRQPTHAAPSRSKMQRRPQLPRGAAHPLPTRMSEIDAQVPARKEEVGFLLGFLCNPTGTLSYNPTKISTFISDL